MISCTNGEESKKGEGEKWRCGWGLVWKMTTTDVFVLTF